MAAVAPVYVEIVTLLKSLRLDQTASPTILQLIDDAMEFARTEIYDGLGPTIANTLVGISYVENATDPAGLNRIKANRLETMLCKMFLLDELRSEFIENSSESKIAWNEIGMRIPKSLQELNLEMSRLRSRANSLMNKLKTGDVEGGDQLQVSVIQTDTVPPGILDSINPYWTRKSRT